MAKKISYVALLFLLATSPLLAQGPTDAWRRGGLEPMVAQPGGAASIMVNPAGIKTWAKRRDGDLKKHEWIFEVVSADLLLSSDAWNLLTNPAGIISKFSSAFGYMTALGKVMKIDGKISDTSGRKAVNLIKGLGQSTYESIRAHDPDLKKDLPANVNDLTVEDLRNMSDSSRLGLEMIFETYNWFPKFHDLPDKFAASFMKNFNNDIGNLSGSQYSRLLELRYIHDKNPLVWGFSLGLEQSFTLRSQTQFTFMPLDIRFTEYKLKANLPIGLQVYATLPLRIAFAYEFNQALPGFTLGLGVRVIPYLGINQTSIGNFLSSSVNTLGYFRVTNEQIYDAFKKSIGLNIGLDLGAQYHFGAIMPELDFLHLGLKISDLVGFNIPFFQVGDQLRYALDFDFGVYADHPFSKNLAIFGGAELIQIRGLFSGGQSPYSALFEPIDHLRLLGGVALFKNLLRMTLQYYNSNFSPGVLLNTKIFQLHAALNLSTASPAWGAEFAVRFRGPKRPAKIKEKKTAQIF